MSPQRAQGSSGGSERGSSGEASGGEGFGARGGAHGSGGEASGGEGFGARGDSGVLGARGGCGEASGGEGFGARGSSGEARGGGGSGGLASGGLGARGSSNARSSGSSARRQTRNVHADLLRGLAIAGMILTHCVLGFLYKGPGGAMPTHLGNLLDSLAVLFVGPLNFSFALFALLFGYTLYLQNSPLYPQNSPLYLQNCKGGTSLPGCKNRLCAPQMPANDGPPLSSGQYLRRMGVLCLFAFASALIYPSGDVLWLLALAGVLVLPLRRLPSGLLLALTLLLALQPWQWVWIWQGAEGAAGAVGDAVASLSDSAGTVGDAVASLSGSAGASGAEAASLSDSAGAVGDAVASLSGGAGAVGDAVASLSGGAGACGAAVASLSGGAGACGAEVSRTAPWLLPAHGGFRALRESIAHTSFCQPLTVLQALWTNATQGVWMGVVRNVNGGRVTMTLVMVMAGLWAGRRHLFDKWRTRPQLLALTLSLLAVLVCFLLKRVDTLGPYRLILNRWQLMACASTLTWTIMVLPLEKPRSHGPLGTLFHVSIRGLSALGQMSLSNYLLHSLLGTLLFYPYGLNLAQQLTPFTSVCVGIGLIIVQSIFSYHWLLHHKRGPLEIIWHNLTCL